MPKDPEETESSEETPDETEETSDEEESTEEDSEEDDSESESSDEGDGDPDQFYDPNKVPKELKGPFKAMQASYVRKMQKFADDIRRGEAFNELTQIPEFKLFVQDMESGRGYGASSPYANSKSKGKGNDSEADDESLGEGDGKLDMDKLMKRLAPALEKMIADKVGPLYGREAERTLENLRARHDDFDHYLPDITKLRKKHPTMDYQEAYDLVSGASKRPKVNKEALAKARKARTEGGSSSKGSVETLTPKTAKTIREALTMAAREQGIQV